MTTINESIEETRVSVILLYCDLRTGTFGMGTHSNQLIQFFGQQPGFDITVVKTDCKFVRGVQRSMDGDIEIIEVPMPQNRIYASGECNDYQLRYAKRISEIIYPYIFDKPNMIVVANTVDHLNLFRALKSLIDARFVYVHHNFTFKYLIKTSYANFAEQWRSRNIGYHPVAFEYTQYQKEMADLADHVVTVTKQAEDFFCDTLGVDRGKISTIYNGLNFDEEVADQDVVESRSRLGLRDGDKIILFCGRIAEEKGIKYLAEAIKVLSGIRDDFKLLVVGDGNISDLLGRSQPYWHKIIFTGSLRSEQIASLYAIADIGVMPSLQEQCSFTAIEMRMNKVPLIVSSIEGLDETFNDEIDALKLTTFYDDAGLMYLSGEEFAAKICRLLDDSDLRRALGQNAYIRGKDFFSSREMLDRYKALFFSLTDVAGLISL